MHSPLIVGITIALLLSLGTCIVQIQSVRINCACTKRLFNLSAETIINVRNARPCATCAIFFLKIKINLFSCHFGQEVYIFEESPKSIQDDIGEVYCPVKYCSNREKCESVGGYVATPRSIHACGKCGACLFVHKVLSTLQEHVNTTKTDKKRFFFATKRWIWYPTKLLIIVPFPSSKYRKKELCGDNKIQETIGNLYCPTCRNEKCVYIWTNKPTSYCDCKKCKACFLVLNFPFKHQKPTNMLFGGDGTHCFARKTSRDYKKEKLSPFLKKFFRQSQSPAPKIAKLSPNME